jgi:hypothetical protein
MNDLLELPDGECGSTLKTHTRRLTETGRIQGFDAGSAVDRLQGCRPGDEDCNLERPGEDEVRSPDSGLTIGERDRRGRPGRMS